ncbi:hypothetical protein BAUCODRAFT_387030 [Baudoinia panamericana UAMH 10762]|uniref:Uncharacterized protein n=1 Tax=Baudoinia panamericana (strain UAMH 10762) TaxID=717646 RepID=M2NI27_BAUPA|nr:uncharacterized protein BAUCODRAFT_387030 [Baudoinia panamericana UAMH 10762]EMC98994.1 hypothetical protein BAUCODRAFT_387030 [Baudoinia panamericana UAMH 10762]
MEGSNHGAYGRTQNIPSGRALEGRASVESPRLQHKRSMPTVRNASQPLSSMAMADRRLGNMGGSSRGAGDGGQARKGSLRNVVRRIFGRRSNEVEPQPQVRSPPRHAYHASEPPKLATQAEEASLSSKEHSMPQRTWSVPMDVLPSPTFERTRSPYAVEFPQSAKLKPIKLGDPFNAPGSKLRRRKTLPSVLLNEAEAAAVRAVVDEPPMPEGSGETPSPDLSRKFSVRNAKRKSRSAGDLKGVPITMSPARNRSDEIRYWRESFQGAAFRTSVVRTSGFTAKDFSGTRYEGGAAERMPLAHVTDDPFRPQSSTSPGIASGSPMLHGASVSDADVLSAAAYGTELSGDLEDRVARLETGLRSFQQAISRLTADRNRRTVLVGSAPQRRSSTDARTPSMLADTLAGPLMEATWHFGYPEPERPSTSPPPPMTPVHGATRRRPAPAAQAEHLSGGFHTPSPPLAVQQQPAQASSTAGTQPQPYTFRSLYEMLADERSARRQLERQIRSNDAQIRNMRQEITDLQYQVSIGSQVQSHRSSYTPLDPTIGSSRLRELLRGTEASPPGTAEGRLQQGGRQQRDSNMTGQTGHSVSANPGMVSRFSASESEMGVPNDSAEELATPYHAYHTPTEDRSRFPLVTTGGLRQSEGEMF